MQSGVCDHPFWRFPNPLPPENAECGVCGARYHQPSSLAGATPEHVQYLRVFWEAIALWLLVREGELPEHEAFQERRRLRRQAQWLYEQLRPTSGAAS